MRDVAARDRQDETRDEAPLTVPPGAIVIDTTDLTRGAGGGTVPDRN